MFFNVTFGRSTCNVSRCLPVGLHRIDVNYRVTFANKHFSFDDADPKELQKLKLVTGLNYREEFFEAFKIGILILLFGRIGHEKIQQFCQIGGDDETEINDRRMAIQEMTASLSALGTRRAARGGR